MQRKLFRYGSILLVALVVVAFVWFSGGSVKDKTDMSKYSNYKYIASENSKKFHTRSCFLGKRIAKDDAAFFNSRTAAKSKGYKPCPICQP